MNQAYGSAPVREYGPGELMGAVADRLTAMVLNSDLAARALEAGIAEILVTNPTRPERGQVRVTDDGAIMWECSYYGEANRDAAEISDVIINSLTLGAGCRGLRTASTGGIRGLLGVPARGM